MELGMVLAWPVESTIVDECLEVLGGVVGKESMRVCNNDEALLPVVARLKMLDMKLRIQHKGYLLIPRQLVILVGKRDEDWLLGHLHHELSQDQTQEDQQGNSYEDVYVVDVCDVEQCAIVLILEEDVLGGEEDHLVLLLTHREEQLHVDFVESVLL